MSKNDHRNGCLNEISLGFVEREAAPKLLMKLGIQFHLIVINFEYSFDSLNNWCRAGSINRP